MIIKDARERLVLSSEVLKSTQGELASGSDHLKNAKRLLEKLERRKRTDRIIFMACLSGIPPEYCTKLFQTNI